MKPKLVVVERAAHRRLKLVDALRTTFQVESVEMLDGVVRTVRSNRPAIVLIGVGRRIQQSTRAVHQIKTDGVNPPLVGLIDWDGRIANPASTAREALADAGVKPGDIDGLFVTPASISGENWMMFAANLGEFLGLTTKALATLENGGITSLLALRSACALYHASA